MARYIGGDRLDDDGVRAQMESFERVWRDHGYGQTALIERATGRMIHPDNTASIRFAERLGFTFDRRDVTPRGAEVCVYRLGTKRLPSQ